MGEKTILSYSILLAVLFGVAASSLVWITILKSGVDDLEKEASNRFDIGFYYGCRNGCDKFGMLDNNNSNGNETLLVDFFESQTYKECIKWCDNKYIDKGYPLEFI